MLQNLGGNMFRVRYIYKSANMNTTEHTDEACKMKFRVINITNNNVRYIPDCVKKRKYLEPISREKANFMYSV